MLDLENEKQSWCAEGSKVELTTSCWNYSCSGEGKIIFCLKESKIQLHSIMFWRGEGAKRKKRKVSKQRSQVYTCTLPDDKHIPLGRVCQNGTKFQLFYHWNRKIEPNLQWMILVTNFIKCKPTCQLSHQAPLTLATFKGLFSLQ